MTATAPARRSPRPWWRALLRYGSAVIVVGGAAYMGSQIVLAWGPDVLGPRPGYQSLGEWIASWLMVLSVPAIPLGFYLVLSRISSSIYQRVIVSAFASAVGSMIAVVLFFTVFGLGISD